MLRAVVIEDEINAANLLEGMLNEIAPTLQVVEKCRDLPSGVKSIKRNKPDVVFLDIELPVYSGIQLLDFFNEEEITFHVIFTTAYNQYAIKAFEMSAADYLLKPIQEEKLKAAISKVLRVSAIPGSGFLPVLKQNLQPDVHKKIVVPVVNGFEILDVKKICYIKAEGSYSEIFIAGQTSLLVSKNLKYFESVLLGIHGFARIHRSFIANLNFAKKILRKDGGTLFLESNIELPVSEEKIDAVFEILGKL
jgi:two-component system LytT family response regulator